MRGGGALVSGSPCRPSRIVGRGRRQGARRDRSSASACGRPAGDSAAASVRVSGAAATGPGPSPANRDKVVGRSGPLAPLRVGSGRLVEGRAPGHHGPGKAGGDGLLKLRVPVALRHISLSLLRATSHAALPCCDASLPALQTVSVGLWVPACWDTIRNARVYVKGREWYTALVCADFWLARATSG